MDSIPSNFVPQSPQSDDDKGIGSSATKRPRLDSANEDTENNRPGTPLRYYKGNSAPKAPKAKALRQFNHTPGHPVFQNLFAA